eukprot:Sdes_comp20825_c1_seq1m17390
MFEHKEYPQNWIQSKPDRIVGSAGVFLLDKKDPIFQMIQHLLNWTIVHHPPVHGGVYNKLQVTRVERNQNRHLWQVYAANRNAIQERIRNEFDAQRPLSPNSLKGKFSPSLPSISPSSLAPHPPSKIHQNWHALSGHHFQRILSLPRLHAPKHRCNCSSRPR